MKMRLVFLPLVIIKGNESTKVQNPRRMCSMASDGVMTNCTC